jgi:hypothetical protein
MSILAQVVHFGSCVPFWLKCYNSGPCVPFLAQRACVCARMLCSHGHVCPLVCVCVGVFVCVAA